MIRSLPAGNNSCRVRSFDELGRQRLDEIEHFFIAYNEAEGRKFKPLARRGSEKAKELVHASATVPKHPARKARKRSKS